uniref:Integrator complex subunit 5-like n=1 Tax=Actinia tenebrosa TaxID=6105 RepID=A0A6P8HBP7_ACTTE
MADEESILETREKELLSNLNSFLSGCSVGGSSLNTIDKIQCCIVLLQSLPCARHAVLEQLCDAFHESMHKYMVEMERKAQLLGSNSTPDVVDADLDNALHRVCDVVRNFVNINPSSWALLICQWCFNLLGDLISKFDQKRGVSLTLSFSEGFHKWMSFPPVQMLMGIATHCCSKLVVNNPDICMETLLQISMKYSPHLDWVVAHIVSHFHDVIVKKLLSTALKDYAATFNDESEEKSVLVSTVVQVLGYLSIQFAQEIKTHLFALFHSSLLQDTSDDKGMREQLATIPFLLHIASLSPELLKGTLSDFVESLTPSVLIKLYDQSVSRSTLYAKHTSLIEVLVDIITNVETGAYSIFCFLLENCCPASNEDDMETTVPHPEVQQTSIYIMERLLLKLQEVTSQRHKLYTQKSVIAPLVKTCTESAFLLEMSTYSNKLIQELLRSNGQRFGWLFRTTVLVSVHSGETTATQVLSYLLLHSKTNADLNVFVQMQCEIEFYYQNVLREMLKKCVALLSNSNASLKPQMVLDLLENLLKLVVAENTEHFPPRCKIVDHLQEHCSTITSLINHSNSAVASKTMSLLLMYNGAEYNTAATKGAICRAVSSFFFRHLKDMAEVNGSYTDIIECIKLCEQMMTKLSRDNYCRLLLIRIIVECALLKENAPLLGGRSQEHNTSKPIESHLTSLLDYNRKPRISSRLALSPSSLFFTGVFGKKCRNGQTKLSDNKTEKTREWLTTSQVYINTLTSLCKCGQDVEHKDQAAMVTSNTDLLASLLMEIVCPEVVPTVGEWPDEDGLKFTVERDIKIRKTFDENPILWWILLLASKGITSLCKCAPVTSSLLATVMSNWEVCRDKTITQSSELFHDTQYIMQAMVEANWLPVPLSRVGGVLHLLSPKEIYAVTNTMWKVLKENPPHPSMAKDEPLWKQGSFTTQKEVVKAIFINNISTLGQHYARVFQSS